MTSITQGATSEAHVRAAADLVGLTLTDGDAAAVADLLSQWIPAAVTLSSRMQAAERESITPITTFATLDQIAASSAGSSQQ